MKNCQLQTIAEGMKNNYDQNNAQIAVNLTQFRTSINLLLLRLK